MRLSSFNDAVADHRERVRAIRRVPFEFQIPEGEIPLRRHVERFPFVPSDPALRNERCYEAYNIQVHALMKRMRAREGRAHRHRRVGRAGFHARAHRRRQDDGPARACRASASWVTRCRVSRRAARRCNNAHALMRALGITASEIDIRPSCQQMLQDLGHPYARGERVYDVTFENVQAGERTSHLFRLANFHNGLVLGTGDLSELALGWCTYGVGDHMSHYNVNASVPKTLIQHLLRWVISTEQFDRVNRRGAPIHPGHGDFPGTGPARDRRGEASPRRAPRQKWVRTICRISIYTTSPAMVSVRARWRF